MFYRAASDDVGLWTRLGISVDGGGEREHDRPEEGDRSRSRRTLRL